MTPKFDKRAHLRKLTRSWPARRAMDFAGRLRKPRPGELSVPMLHHTLSVARLEDQIDALLADGVPVSGRDVLAALEGERELPLGATWFTCDDAYGDFLELAADVFERRGVPVTHFVATAYVGDDPATFWWDRLEAAFQATTRRDTIAVETPTGRLRLPLASHRDRSRSFRAVRTRVKELRHEVGIALADDVCSRIAPEAVSDARVMTWDQLAGLAARGFEIAGHTHTHPMLDRVDTETVVSEVERGFEELEARIPQTVPIFAYPSGQYDAAVRDAVARTRARAAVTTRPGVHHVGTDSPFEIPRVSVGPLADGPVVRARLLAARAR